MADLTTLANVKLYTGITGTDYDAILEEMIDAVTAQIERYCNREFTQANFRMFKFIQNDGAVNLKVRNHPVTRVYGAWYGYDEMVSVDLNATDTTFYQTYLDLDTLTISAEDGDTTNAYTLSDYDDLEALFDAVLVDYAGFTITYRDDWYKQLPPQVLIPDAYNNVYNTQPDDISFYGCSRPLRISKVGDRLFRIPNVAENTPVILFYQAGYVSPAALLPGLEMICKKLVQGVWERSGQGASVTGIAEREKIGKYEVEESAGGNTTKAYGARGIQGLVNGLMSADVLNDLDLYRNKDLTI